MIHRDAAFRNPSLQQICRSLSNQAPANAADLAALVVDRMDDLADQIRGGNTDDWRQYWNEDVHGRPTTPKREESCRDALLSGLSMRLPDGVDAQPEGQYAGQTRRHPYRRPGGNQEKHASRPLERRTQSTNREVYEQPRNRWIWHLSCFLVRASRRPPALVRPPPKSCASVYKLR